MQKPELQDTLKSLFPILEEGPLNAFVKHASFLKSSKGIKLITEGKKHDYFYLVLKGGVKSYYLRESREVCVWFAFKNETVATIRTFEGLHSNETIETLEDSELIRFETQPIKKLARTNLAISSLITELITEHAIFLEERLYQLQFMSSKERYKALILVAPELLQKVSLTDIASYLGISRETLSRIRGKE